MLSVRIEIVSPTPVKQLNVMLAPALGSGPLNAMCALAYLSYFFEGYSLCSFILTVCRVELDDIYLIELGQGPSWSKVAV